MVVASYRKTHTMKLRIIPFFVLAVLSLLSCSRYSTPVYTDNSPVERRTTVNNAPGRNMEESILYYVNAYRRSHGLGSLQPIDAATQQAFIHSRNMATGRTAFGHDGFSTRVNNVRNAVGFVSAAAENVAYGNMSAKEVVDGWLHSPGHRKNIEGNYNQTGIGISEDRQGVLYFTQLFIRK